MKIVVGGQIDKQKVYDTIKGVVGGPCLGGDQG